MTCIKMAVLRDVAGCTLVDGVPENVLRTWPSTLENEEAPSNSANSARICQVTQHLTPAESNREAYLLIPLQ